MGGNHQGGPVSALNPDAFDDLGGDDVCVEPTDHGGLDHAENVLVAGSSGSLAGMAALRIVGIVFATRAGLDWVVIAPGYLRRRTSGARQLLATLVEKPIIDRNRSTGTTVRVSKVSSTNPSMA